MEFSCLGHVQLIVRSRFVVIYERKYECSMRSLFDYFSKIPKFLPYPAQKAFLPSLLIMTLPTC